MINILQEVNSSAFDMIVVIGGDGTLNEAVTGYLTNSSYQTPLLCFPGGTGNDFCRALGILTYRDAVKALLASIAVKLDIGRF